MLCSVAFAVCILTLSSDPTRVVLGPDVFDAVEVAQDFQRTSQRSTLLSGVCVTADATTPKYRMTFYDDDEPLCIVRPWRSSGWMVLERDDACVCSS